MSVLGVMDPSVTVNDIVKVLNNEFWTEVVTNQTNKSNCYVLEFNYDGENRKLVVFERHNLTDSVNTIMKLIEGESLNLINEITEEFGGHIII